MARGVADTAKFSALIATGLRATRRLRRALETGSKCYRNATTSPAGPRYVVLSEGERLRQFTSDCSTPEDAPGAIIGDAGKIRLEVHDD
jgi:hypothetical protein